MCPRVPQRFAGAGRETPPLPSAPLAESAPLSKLAHIQFGMFTWHEMARAAEVNVSHQGLYNLVSRVPVAHGVLDGRLGVSDKSSMCATCGAVAADCPGHWGVIDLHLPVFNVGFFKEIIGVAQSVCKVCARVLLKPKDRKRFLHRMRSLRLGSLERTRTRTAIVDACKKVKLCPWCGAHNGTVKRLPAAPTMHIVHDKYKDKGRSKAALDDLHERMAVAAAEVPDVAEHQGKATEDLTPLVLYKLFSAIPDGDLDLLYMAQAGRPESMILHKVMVPPVCIRPSVSTDGGGATNEDDLTVKLREVIEVNNAIALAMEQGTTTSRLMTGWDILQNLVAEYISGDAPGASPPGQVKKPIRALANRLKGKQGRFRGNLSGKRVNFSGRTVISPDPLLPIYEVGVPELVAQVLTFPTLVTESNLHRMRQLVLNGPTYPGANKVRKANGMVRSLLFGDRSAVAAELQVGDEVQRHMQNGDFVLFNRQPSLHKLSIMAHQAHIFPHRTFRFNECVCAPYNADFDGDEMNLHLPQTLEAQAEAAQLMEVRHNVVTPRSGEPLVAANQDFISAGYLITQRNLFFDRDTFMQIVASLSDSVERVEVPPPAILKPTPLWTGKQVTTMLLRPNAAEALTPTLEVKACGYAGKKPDGSQWGIMCPEDGYVVVRHGEHLAGTLDKKSLGGSKNGLIYILYNDFSRDAAARFMKRMTRMLVRWLSNWGFSIGIQDVLASQHVLRETTSLIQGAYVESDELIAQYRQGTLPLQPGCDLLQSLEASMNGLLGRVRDKAGQMCMAELPFHNTPRAMADCGSKGGSVNICQMMACLGQQNVSGGRIPEGFVNRTLPIYEPGSKDPPAKGFVMASFTTGLNAAEFFFHTMGGREGLVDTAVKTANTGYMQRKLVKALEDLSVRYDGTVRTSTGQVVQFVYGDDNLNPAHMARDGSPADWDRLMAAAVADIRCQGGGHAGVPLTGDQLRTMAQRLPRHPALAKLLPVAAGDAAPTAAGVPQPRSKFLELASGWLLRLAEAADAQVARVTATAGGRPDVVEALLDSTAHVTFRTVNKVLSTALRKFRDALIEPGEGVGAVAASSLGEPATQMTLKTFHFAGVASMNVTLGVPRLLEIMNASKVISTPIIEAPLVSDNSEVAARMVKARLEKTTLGEIASSIAEVYSPSGAFVRVELDLTTIHRLRMAIDSSTVAAAIMAHKPLKLKDVHVSVQGPELLLVRPPTEGYKLKGAQFKAAADAMDTRAAVYFALQRLKRDLPRVIIAGIPTVVRAVISRGEVEGDPDYKLAVEGTGLLEVMGTPGIRGTATKSNHVVEVQGVLGIEAARTLIMDEMNKTYSNYGIEIDRRHLMLLADVMTYRGEVLSVNRFGISKMKDSVLMLASFEQTNDHLFHAAAHSKVDSVEGVSECIITGQPMSIGTGCFDLLQETPDAAAPPAEALPAASVAGAPSMLAQGGGPPHTGAASGAAGAGGPVSSSPLAQFMQPPPGARATGGQGRSTDPAPSVAFAEGCKGAPEEEWVQGGAAFRPPPPLLTQLSGGAGSLPPPLWEVPPPLTLQAPGGGGRAHHPRSASDASSVTSRRSRQSSTSSFSPLPQQAARQASTGKEGRRKRTRKAR